MAKIHMVLQGKGGVGKSFIAALIAQYKISKGQRPLCIDTDPVNSTFAGYNAIAVRQLQIMDGDEINSRNFDTLVELIAESRDDRHHRQWRRFIRADVSLPIDQPGAAGSANDGA